MGEAVIAAVARRGRQPPPRAGPASGPRAPRGGGGHFLPDIEPDAREGGPGGARGGPSPGRSGVPVLSGPRSIRRGGSGSSMRAGKGSRTFRAFADACGVESRSFRNGNRQRARPWRFTKTYSLSSLSPSTNAVSTGRAASHFDWSLDSCRSVV
ncbi:hypothetical protein EVAR_92962_1 [Eumeta japonica]|uniref:Uncharacterized protein n=1 Tax=Eumeta variegata TaxID=151549 RepID=A0A4C1TDE3_EUMVA|nr:hypothetical protein EVAR_92962_1 [Eumeta japonica]